VHDLNFGWSEKNSKVKKMTSLKTAADVGAEVHATTGGDTLGRTLESLEEYMASKVFRKANLLSLLRRQYSTRHPHQYSTYDGQGSTSSSANAHLSV
jgi:hypothetical protein